MKQSLYLILALLFLSACSRSADEMVINLNHGINEEYVKDEIQKSNYCSIKEDCALVDANCPFDCYSYVNQNELERINDLIRNFFNNRQNDEVCLYDCPYCPEVGCMDGKCLPLRSHGVICY